MKKTVELIFKGVLIGIGKIIPGVSGSLIALSLGVYEDAIYAISNFFKDFKNNLTFLGTISIGIILSIMLGSNLISYFLKYHYIPTMFLFIGMIIGTVFEIKNKIYKKHIYIIITVFIISLIILFLKNNNEYVLVGNLKDYIYLFIIGFIDAVTMIIPGISGTAIFMIMGCYQEILYIFGNIIKILFSKPLIIIFLMVGIIIGIIITSKIMNYLFKKKESIIYATILGFSLSTVLFLIINTISNYINMIEILISIAFLIIGYCITKYSKHII